MALTDEQREARKLYRRKWRKENPEKLKAQRLRHYKKTYVKKIPYKPYENELEYERLRQRLDTVLMADSYLKENIARRMNISAAEVPEEILEACRALLQLKRELRKTDRWINVNHRLPEPEINILICNDKGEVQFGIYGSSIDGYQFFTTNFEQYLLPGTITHWMPLPKPPK